MKKIFLSFVFVLATTIAVWAAGTSNPYQNHLAPQDATVKQEVTNAVQLAQVRTELEKTLENTSKLSFAKRMVLKSAINKIKKAEKTNGGINGTLMTIGIILMIVGLVLLVLGVALSGGHYYGGGGGLIVLGLILWLVGKFVDL